MLRSIIFQARSKTLIEEESRGKYYCGACHYWYFEAHEINGLERDIYKQDDQTSFKETVCVVFIQCPYKHTIGVRDGIVTDDLPF